jgi:anti-sigma regulatory factor (Ser/Thr protein kinase)
MRLVGYDFAESNYEKVLMDFCTLEGFQPVKEPSDYEGMLFFITDKEDALTCDKKTTAPRCIVSAEQRSSNGCYVLNSRLSVQALRMLVDMIYHGSIIWNNVGGLRSERTVKEYVMDNNIVDIERFVCLVTHSLLLCHPFSFVEKIRIGFSEMLTNAVEHGNLGITNREKFQATEAGNYQELLEERLADPIYSKRKTHIRFTCVPGKLEIRIKDEGDGFDIKSLPSPADTDQLMKLHGRGILITSAYFDELRYNAKGNMVTLTKNTY